MTLKKLVEKVPIEVVVGKDFELNKSGERYYRAVEHDSLVVDTKRNLFYWNSLDIYGNALDWLVKIKGMSLSEAAALLQEYSGIPFQKSFDSLFEPRYPYYRLTDAFHELGKTYRDYWYFRGYADRTIDHFKLGYTGRFYVIPITHKGKLLNFQCRTPDKKIWNWTRGTGKQPFNFAALEDTDWIIVTESPVDAIIAWQHNYPAISLFPNALNWDRTFIGHLARMKTIYLMFDNDAAGKRGANKVGFKFRSRARVVDWEGYPEKMDIGEILLMEDGVSRMNTLLTNCLPYMATKNETSWEWYKSLRERKTK